MITRYYVCPVVGDGTRANPYRPAVADHGVSYVAIIQTAVDGRPTKSWTVCRVDAADHAPLLADLRLRAIPDNGQWAAAARTALSTMTGRSLSPTDTTRDVIVKLCQAHIPGFDLSQWAIDGSPSN